MQRIRIGELSLHRVSCPEPPCGLVVVPRPQIVETDAVRPLAAIEVVVGGGTTSGDEAADGVILIRVSDRSCAVSQETHVGMAVVAVEAWSPGRAVELVLADPLQAVGVGPRDPA